MKIAIDVSRIANEKAGVGRYTANLVKTLIDKDTKNEYLLLCSFFRGDEEKRKIMSAYQRPNVKIKYLKLPGKFKESLWHSKLPLVERFLGDADVYLAPTFLDVISNLKIPQAVVIHDLSTFKYPEHLGKKQADYFNRQTRKAVKLAKKIIAISENTEKDLLEILKVPEQKIEVIYPGQSKFAEISPNLPAGLKEQSYVLYVGTVEPRKNLIGLFEAYALLAPTLQEKYPLVVVGAQGWNTGDTYRVFSALKLENKVKFLGYQPDKMLAKLYKEAAVFCYPSLYEGFGIPVLEAMEFSLPVVTSNISSLPEVAGEAAVLVDPSSSRSISEALQRLLEHKDEAEVLGKKAKIQAQKFDWQKTAQKVSKMLESLVK